MKIVKVSAIPMSAPVPEEKRHRTDLGTKVKSDATLIRVETDDGLTGIGAALGTPPIVAAIVEHELAAECVDEDPMFSERIYEKMYNGSRSRPALERGITQADESRRRGVIMEAIAGIDIAVWDVKAQVLGISLYQALGATRSSVRGYASGGWAPGDEAETELAGYAEKGFTAAKMRVVGRDGFSISNCVRRVKAARRGLGPNVELMIDAHGSLEVATAIKLAKELEPYDIAWFEEPVSPDDHAGQAEVRRSTTIPIASGEREFTRFDFQDLLERRALDIAQPDVARAGGMTEIRRIAALTSAHGVRLAPHAWGSGVLFAASIHVAMAAPNCHILEVSQGYMPMMWELFNEPFDIRPDGMVHAPDRPGLGFTLRPDALERFRYVDGPNTSSSGIMLTAKTLPYVGVAGWRARRRILGVIEHIPIRNRDHRSALGSFRTREANLTAWRLAEKQWPNCRVTPAVNRRPAKAQNCPTAIRSRQREGLTQSGGYNLFVLTSWKADPGPHVISKLAARCGSDQHHCRCR